jgi:hypothetical protein
MKLLRSFGYGLSTLAIYLSITLLGWGLRHLEDYLFGERRQDYCCHSWKLVPYIY